MTQEEESAQDVKFKKLFTNCHEIARKLHASHSTILLLDHHLQRINSSPWWKLGMQLSRFFENCANLVLLKNQKNEFEAPTKPNKSIDKIIGIPFSWAAHSETEEVKFAVIMHAYYIDQIPDFYLLLKKIPYNFDIFISTNEDTKKEYIKDCFSHWTKGKVDIRVFPNRGRDIAPKFVGFKDVHFAYDYVLHLHTKLSPYGGVSDLWQPFLLDCLIGSDRKIDSIFTIFKKCPEIGVIAPRNFFAARKHMVWAENIELCEQLGERLNIKLTAASPLDFAAGSMFWARTAALMPLLNLNLKFEDFPEEAGQRDATLAHAIERMTFYSAECAGFLGVHVGEDYGLEPYEELISVNSAETLNTQISSAASQLI